MIQHEKKREEKTKQKTRPRTCFEGKKTLQVQPDDRSHGADVYKKNRLYCETRILFLWAQVDIFFRWMWWRHTDVGYERTRTLEGSR